MNGVALLRWRAAGSAIGSFLSPSCGSQGPDSAHTPDLEARAIAREAEVLALGPRLAVL